MGGAAIGLGCHRSAVRSGYADALPVPHRTDTSPAGAAGAGVRVLSGGVQRRAAGPRRGLSGRDQVVGYRDSAPCGHRGQDYRGSGVVARGAQCGVGAVGQRFPSCLAQLLRLDSRKAPGPQSGPATVQVAQGSSAVVSAHPQRILGARQWPVVCGEGGRTAGALVARSAVGAVERHDHSGAGWPLLRQFRRRRSIIAAAGGGARSRGGYGDRPVGDRGGQRRYTYRCLQSKAFGPQAAQAGAVGTGEVPPAEGIAEQGQVAAQGCDRAQRGGPGTARLSPQAGFGVGMREPSDPRRGPQHRGDGQKPSFGAGDFGCGMGAVRADHHRKGRPLRAHRPHGVAVAGIEQDLLGVRVPTRRTPTPDPSVGLPGVPGGPRSRPQRRESHSRRRAGGETKRLWSPGKSSHHSGGTGR